MAQELSSTKIVFEATWGEKLRSRVTVEHFELPDVGLVAIEQKLLGVIHDMGDWGKGALTPIEQSAVDSMLG